MYRHVEVNVFAEHVCTKLSDGVDALVYIEPAVDVVEDAPDSAFSGDENGLAIVRVTIDPLDGGGSHKERIVPIFDLILVVATPSLDIGDFTEARRPPLTLESRQPPPSSQ